MAVETELKLRISAGQLARLKRHALLKTHSVNRPVTRRLYNIYYDTAKLDLYRSAQALRLRHVGRQWLQTLKGGGSVQAGLHRRNEWEMPVRGAALEFSAHAEWDRHLPRAMRKKLRPVFVTDFFRNSRMLLWHGAQIELCMDQGQVSTEQSSTPICELELELKSGEPRQLFELALALAEIVPFELESVSKAEQGYRLLCGYIPQPVKGAAPSFAKTATQADVLKALIWSCLQHFQANLSGAMNGGSEYLHQMRVALRRLRVVLGMAGKIHFDATLVVLSKDVAALCVALGRIREWDVFIDLTVQPMCARMPGHDGLHALLMAGEEQRSACYATLRGTDHALEMQRLLLRFAIWMHGPYWQEASWQHSASTQSAEDFAARRLQKWSSRFTHSVRHLSSYDAERLHALRIVAKKLRYSADFFGCLYDNKKVEAFLAALSEVQDVLGQINDVAVAHRLLESLAGDASMAGHQDAVLLAQGWIAHDLSRLFAVLRKTIRRFKKQAAFWQK